MSAKAYVEKHERQSHRVHGNRDGFGSPLPGIVDEPGFVIGRDGLTVCGCHPGEVWVRMLRKVVIDTLDGSIEGLVEPFDDGNDILGLDELWTTPALGARTKQHGHGMLVES